MKHKGIRELEVEEIAANALGQNGFHILYNAIASAEFLASDYRCEYWCEIKSIEDYNLAVKARSIQAGGDLTSREHDGSKDIGTHLDDLGYGVNISTLNNLQHYDYSDANMQPLLLSPGTSITGAFDKVTLGVGHLAIAYVGKW